MTRNVAEPVLSSEPNSPWPAYAPRLCPDALELPMPEERVPAQLDLRDSSRSASLRRGCTSSEGTLAPLSACKVSAYEGSKLLLIASSQLFP